MSKQYIVTDPCYIIGNEEWSKICDQCSNNGDWNDDKFNSLCSDALKVLSGTKDACACHTGFGDWSNAMHCSNDNKVIQCDFFADSGMVCVVEYNDKIKAALKSKDNERLVDEDVGGAAIIECDGDVKIEFDTEDPDWTVVYIEDDHDCFNSCLPMDEEEDDDE